MPYLPPRNNALVDRRANYNFFNDFLTGSLGSGNYMPFYGGGLSTGTVSDSILASNPQHPGVVTLRSSATANSGYHIQTPLFTALNGQEVFDVVLMPITFTSTTTRIGFVDTSTISDAANGVYFEIAPTTGVCTAKTAAASVRTSNATTVTLTAGTWYRFTITVNDAKNNINFQIRNDAGTVLLDVNITSNIPTAATPVWKVITNNSGTVLTNLVHLDYMGLRSAKRLVRG